MTPGFKPFTESSLFSQATYPDILCMNLKNRILGKFTKNGGHERMSRYPGDSLPQYFVCAIYSGHVIVRTKLSYKMLQAKKIEVSNVISNKPSNRVQIFILILF